ncbi:peptide-methionine (S)-S-oxide reductase [Candidatus Saccharibacteria bacterium RIFCSPHIGHO2_01_FULL_45_15]|nr:MAG: peptide-methionine (S)-S-oxide reductase [Candidatus Saccharibacteria bacterium RIFCSPHIGHO2_01_FULL_45_15]OGL28663.1 MAG: peptide-methionine (S)-S-oxide reductase [Candidatus Saccharibacteria bacterium RIFCSPHIGHO2_02_FULL_46_12]OGL31464.1 MAG: peptide-methionine (S)-S-oxide reductase [Candidatus Saccharibacteria bacterium RIFCSPHIGHO2_12_FULL_44_22]
MTTYVLGGGCFWCLDAAYRRIRGVTEVVSGYAGGETENPDYYQVGSGRTGHAEVIQITFDEAVIPAEIILDIFFTLHDPTTLNRQGADHGTQYRSIMLYADNDQKAEFEASIERAKAIWDDPIVTEVVPLETFYAAEPEHQDYFNNNPTNGYCSIVITPKIVKVRSHYNEWFIN